MSQLGKVVRSIGGCMTCAGQTFYRKRDKPDIGIGLGCVVCELDERNCICPHRILAGKVG